MPDYFRGKLKLTNDPTRLEALNLFIRQTEEAVEFLHDKEKTGYKLFLSYSLVAHWAYFEAFLDDLVSASLEETPGIHERLSEYFESPNDKRWSLASLMRKLGDRGFTKSRNFSKYVEKILNCIEIPVFEFNETEAVALNFSNAARNCFLHNGGIWDEKGCESAGIDRSFVGRSVEFSEDSFLRCYDAVAKILNIC